MIQGRVWKFGSDINTDLILPTPVIFKPPEEQPRWVFSANRPGWAQGVQPGDVIVAARNFGTGSGRPAARVLKDLGIACVVAESINGLFFRNCVNYALPALECAGIHDAFDELDVAEIDFERATVRNRRTGRALAGRPWPLSLRRILEAGGLLALLRTEGYLGPVVESGTVGTAPMAGP
ncbi:MAG: 3-isopropylmalate dehydratase [Candidatus Rokubacteria bacterium]|nr:3-isopropylmalate dehydratase [Candidatus Rokubacteria bacterium]